MQELSLLELVRSYSAPKRPQPGNLIYADGTKYNPGSGEKLYYQNSSKVWVPVASEAYADAGDATNAAAIAALGSAWTLYTPTPTPTVGAFTTASGSGAYKQIGKTIAFTATAVITTVGTASGSLLVPIPVGTAHRAFQFVAADVATVGFMGYGRLSSGGSTILINKYDNSSYISAGVNIVVSGVYEIP